MGEIVRMTNSSTGGPVFVYVQDGKIVRITPMDFDDSVDAASWKIEARGKTYTPPRKTTYSVYTAGFKSMIYSDKRIMYPMKRVDFDPNGERNIQNRGVSGYERITWDEATDLLVSRDQPGQARSRPGRHRHQPELPPHVGQRGLPPQHLLPLHEHDRDHLCRPQPGQLGRAGTGAACTCGASAGAWATPSSTTCSRTP